MIYLVGFEKVKRDRGGGPVKEVQYLDVRGVCRSRKDAEALRVILQDGELDEKASIEAVNTEGPEITMVEPEDIAK